MHAANTQTSLKVANLPAGGTKKLSFKADVPGVYMYHCAPGGHGIMTHTMGGMFGMFVVEPKQKYTMEEELGRVPDIKVYLVQHETYANGRDFFDGQPLYVSFNGYNFRYVNQPIAAKPGDYIRFYYVNVDPNLTATFHAVGGIWNYSYSQGNPANKLVGGQSILAGPSDSFVIDWQVPAAAAGPFTMVSHALGTQAAKGAVGIISAKEDAPRPHIVRSEGPNLALPILPKRVVDPFGIGSSDVDRAAHFHEGDPVLIQMVGNSFHPKIIEVPVGTEVHWVNEDVFDVLDGERSGKHSIMVTAGAETFTSPELLHADKFHYTFTKPGVYEYICPVHPYMKGRIKVY
jgi:nitrite reductase (NO-forming)